MSICAVVVVLNMLQALWSSASLVDPNVGPSGRVYAGQVVDRDGRPVAGAEVRGYVLRWLDYNDLAEPQLERQGRTSTQEDGKFQLDVRVPAGWQHFVVSVIVHKQGYATSGVQWVPDAAPNATIVLATPTTLAGTIVDEIRAPLAGVKVGVSLVRFNGRGERWLNGRVLEPDLAAVTDEHGRFVMAGIDPNMTAELRLEKSGRPKVKTFTMAGHQMGHALHYAAGQQDIRIVMRGSTLAGDTARSRIDRILTSWERQEAIFQTLRFATSWEIGGGQGGSLQESQEYLIAKDGRFRLARTRRSFGNELSSAKDGLREVFAFDGQVDWWYEQRGESPPFAEIGVKGRTPSPIGLPTYFMPHLVGDYLKKVFADPNATTWSELPDGSWTLECRQKPSGTRMGVAFDPKQDFLVTRLNTWSQAGEVNAWIQTEYCRTLGGFWYPVKADYKFECGWTAKMVTTDFRLNERDPNFQIEIPAGTLVADHRTDPRFPETYYQGKPRTYGGPLGKTYEDVLRQGGRLIAGVCTHPDGRPVFGAYAYGHGMRFMEDGQWIYSVGCCDTAYATTDAAGRFAMPVPVDGKYALVLHAKGYAPAVVYDVPQDTKNLKVQFTAGATVSGRVVRHEGDVKSAVAGAQVAIKNIECEELESNYDQEAVTDQEGRFTFKYLSTHMRSRKDDCAEHWSLTPRPWTVSAGKTSVQVVFDKTEDIKDLELVIEPDPNQASNSQVASDRHEP